MQLPEPFIHRMQLLLGSSYDAFVASLASEPSHSIRINPLKGATPHPEATAVPWCEGGYYLPTRHNYTFDPLLHGGAYYVQEASSMFLAQAMGQYITEPVRYLDLCAAPGGKTTLALATLPKGSLVVCNEYVRSRAHILAENVTKWGNPNVVVTHNDTAAFAPLTHYFDVIAADVPCSGEGMFRKDAEAISEWSEGNVTLCAQRQRTILANAWSALHPGGILIYSTCTYNTEENEEMVQHLIDNYGATPLPIHTDPSWGVSGALVGEHPCYRFMPHLAHGEGLFVALLRKPNDEPSQRNTLLASGDKRAKKGKGKRMESTTPIPKEVEQWLTTPAHYQLTQQEGRISAIPTAYAADMQLLAQLNVLQAGIPLAELKGRDIVPQHALALSTQLNTKAFECVELPYLEAINYLKREALQLPPDTPKGIVLLTYQGYPLGWAKQIGNRANNLYPQEWRIRSGFLPEVISSPVK